MQIDIWAGQWLMFMAKGCEIENASMWKGPEYCRAPPSCAEAGADAKSPTRRPGWHHLDALLQRT